VELQDVIMRALHSAEKNLEDRKQTTSLNIKKEPIRLNIDTVRIEQVITNLLNNASKFTEEKGHISISAQQLGGMAEVRIKDNGIGIDPMMLGQIFEPFIQIEGRRTNDGLGIGLSLAKQLVEMHEGTIEARSKGRGHGSEFILRLPMLAMTAQQEYAVRKPSHSGLSAISTTHRVLIVDDNEEAAQGIGKLLNYMGYSVNYAYTGAQAVQEAARFHPDSIILDIGLPDMDGYHVAEAIRRKIKFSGTLIALTGYGQDEDKQKAYAAGFDHHLTKPIGIANLQNILRVPSDRH
jgi:CheY-like chemotaxis protein/anti-sigma regulatory factor (Ser/Thr protein kinase)